MIRRNGRYDAWLEAWPPEHPSALSTEGQRTLQLAGMLQQGVAWQTDLEQSPILEKRKRDWLTRKVNPTAPDLRTLQTWDEAYALFGVVRKGARDVNDAKFIRTFVWQFVVGVLGGRERPVRGNLRSVWYRELRAVLFRLKLLEYNDDPGDDGTVDEVRLGKPTNRGAYLLDVMEEAFQQMFLAGFFRYSDLQVYDARENFWVLGKERAGIVFFTEKEGLYWLCREIQARFGVTVIASRGSPIWITVDYMVAALRRRGVSNVLLVCLSDYDPWGYDMGRQVQVKFADPVFDLRRVGMDMLTRLSLFSPQRLESSKRYLLVGHPDPKDPVHEFVMAWVARTGGIHGEPYGIHVDHAEPNLVLEAFERWLKERTVNPLGAD